MGYLGTDSGAGISAEIIEQVEDNVADIAINVADIDTNETDIDTNEGSIDTINTTLSNLNAQVSTNTGDISTLQSSDHPQSHTVVSHSDTTATGAELNSLTSGSDTNLHHHPEDHTHANSAILAATTSSFLTNDKTRLVAMEDNATQDQTKADIDALGINAAQIDGIEGTSIQQVSEKGIANGYASLDANATVPANQLPSFVDDVEEYANLASFPGTGETGKIYVAIDTNKTYRWSGSAYIYITSGAVDSVAGKTGVVTLVKNDVGLANVDNTADSNKNVLTATRLLTSRTISLAGDCTGSASFNGSANVSITVIIADDSHIHDGRYYTESEIDSMVTGLESITETNTGWRYIDANASNYGNIGVKATDLSYSSGASTVLGATGSYSLTYGIAVRASGYASFAGGRNTVALNSYMVALGSYNSATSGDTVFEFGIGTTGDRKNAIEIYTDGTLTMPESTIAEIDSRGSKAIVTKEYVDMLNLETQALIIALS